MNKKVKRNQRIIITERTIAPVTAFKLFKEFNCNKRIIEENCKTTTTPGKLPSYKDIE